MVSTARSRDRFQAKVIFTSNAVHLSIDLPARIRLIPVKAAYIFTQEMIKYDFGTRPPKCPKYFGQELSEIPVFGQ